MKSGTCKDRVGHMQEFHKIFNEKRCDMRPVIRVGFMVGLGTNRIAPMCRLELRLNWYEYLLLVRPTAHKLPLLLYDH